jgi:choline dehydrogenase
VAFPNTSAGRLFDRNWDLLRLISKSGEIKLRSASYADPLYITLNFANNLDLVATREGVRFVDDSLINSDGMKDIIGEDYPWPMLRHSDEAMNRAILECSQTGFRKCISSVALPQ